MPLSASRIWYTSNTPAFLSKGSTKSSRHWLRARRLRCHNPRNEQPN